jgi:hypothetical protein
MIPGTSHLPEAVNTRVDVFDDFLGKFVRSAQVIEVDKNSLCAAW